MIESLLYLKERIDIRDYDGCIDITWPVEDIPIGSPDLHLFSLTNKISKRVAMGADEIEAFNHFSDPYCSELTDEVTNWLNHHEIPYEILELSGLITNRVAKESKPVVSRFYTWHIRFMQADHAMLFKLTWE